MRTLIRKFSDVLYRFSLWLEQKAERPLTEEDLDHAWDAGFARGKSEGYTQAEYDLVEYYLDILEDEIDDAYNRGFDDGVEEAEAFQIREVIDPYEAYNEGWEDGYDEAEYRAWDAGFEEGWDAAMDSRDLTDSDFEEDFVYDGAYDIPADWDDWAYGEIEDEEVLTINDLLNPVSEAV